MPYLVTTAASARDYSRAGIFDVRSAKKRRERTCPFEARDNFSTGIGRQIEERVFLLRHNIGKRIISGFRIRERRDGEKSGRRFYAGLNGGCYPSPALPRPSATEPERSAVYQKLRHTRFLDALEAIEVRRILLDFEHPNQSRYPGQRMAYTQDRLPKSAIQTPDRRRPR